MTPPENADRAARIAELNDRFRTSFEGGTVLITHGIDALSDMTKIRVISTVRTFNEFTEDNDPYGERDFGAFDIDEHKIFWKIDAYDKTMEFGSPDPADPSVTSRVLTILLASEY